MRLGGSRWYGAQWVAFSLALVQLFIEAVGDVFVCSHLSGGFEVRNSLCLVDNNFGGCDDIPHLATPSQLRLLRVCFPSYGEPYQQDKELGHLLLSVIPVK